MKALETVVAVCIMCNMISSSYGELKIAKENKDTLSCRSSSDISWKHNGQSIANGIKYTITYEKNILLQITESTLYISNITVADEGLYQCVQESNEMVELTLTGEMQARLLSNLHY